MQWAVVYPREHDVPFPSILC